MNIRLELQSDFGPAANELRDKLVAADLIVKRTLKAHGAPVVIWNGKKFRGIKRIRKKFLNGSQL